MSPENGTHSNSVADTQQQNTATNRWRWLRVLGVLMLTSFGVVFLLFPSRVSLQSVDAVMQSGDLSTASSLIDNYLKQSPEDVRGWMLKATLAERTGNLRDAADAYSRASALRPTDLNLLHRCAKSIMKSAQFQSAEAVCS